MFKLRVLRNPTKPFFFLRVNVTASERVISGGRFYRDTDIKEERKTMVR